MMTRTHILNGLALVLMLSAPVTASAYMTPEEVLTSDENSRFFEPPPSQRETDAIAEQQASSAAARRAAEQAALFGSSSSATAEDDSLHGAAPEIDDETTMDDSSDTSGLSAADQRILERVKDRQLELMIQEQAQILASQQSLHGGAPLADTGTGTILVVVTLGIAGAWTLWKARKMETK